MRLPGLQNEDKKAKKLRTKGLLKVSFEDKANPRSKSRSTNELTEELQKLIEICCQNLLYLQELQKRVHDKRVKNCSYALGEKIWLNSQYIKTKRNRKLENKFFDPFSFLYLVGK